MSINFPTSLDTSTQLPQPSAGNFTNNPSHAGTHDNESQAIIALETKLGIGSSTAIANTVLRGTGVGTSAFGSLVLSTDITGILPVANGGTGVTTSTGTGSTVLSTSPIITTPHISSIVNTGTLTLPTSTDTLVGRATTDTLTNKTIAGLTNSVSANTFTNPYKFSVHRVAAANSGNAAFALLTFDTKYYDTGTNYSTSTGLFTAPVAGFYHFSTVVGSSTAATIAVSIFKNGSEFQRLQEGIVSGGVYWFFVGSIDMQLAANDTIGIYVYGSTTAVISVSAGSDANFSGHLISTT